MLLSNRGKAEHGQSPRGAEWTEWTGNRPAGSRILRRSHPEAGRVRWGLGHREHVPPRPGDTAPPWSSGTTCPLPGSARLPPSTRWLPRPTPRARQRGDARVHTAEPSSVPRASAPSGVQVWDGRGFDSYSAPGPSPGRGRGALCPPLLHGPGCCDPAPGPVCGACPWVKATLRNKQQRTNRRPHPAPT